MGKEAKKIVNKNDICVDYNNYNISYKYEYLGKYYDTCVNGSVMNNYTIKNCSCNTEKCLSCPMEPLKEDLCKECNNHYYGIENDDYLYIEGYIKCYNNPKGYYLDENIYKKCFYTCQECEKIGDNKTHNCLKCNDNYPFEIKNNNYSNNCLKCNDNYPFEIKNNNYSNCYENCSYYYYFDDENNLSLYY